MEYIKQMKGIKIMSEIKIIGAEGMHFDFDHVIVSVQIGKNMSCSNKTETSLIPLCENAVSKNAAVAIFKDREDFTLMVKNKLNLKVSSCGDNACAEMTHVKPEDVAKILNFCANGENF